MRHRRVAIGVLAALAVLFTVGLGPAAADVVGGFIGDTVTGDVVSVPEPSSLVLLGTGLVSLLGVAAWRSRRR